MTHWPELHRSALEETTRLLAELPSPIRDKIASIPVVLEKRPSRALIQDGVEDDVMGLFVGDDFTHEGNPLPPEILLFLENICDEALQDEKIFRAEVRKTLLHEIGHYLGLNEEELWEREMD